MLSISRWCLAVTLGVLLVFSASQVFDLPTPQAAGADDTYLPFAPLPSMPNQPPAVGESIAPPPSAATNAESLLDAGNPGVLGAANVRMINFTAALGLVGAQNPHVGFANQRIAEAYGQLRGAEALWLPSIRAGLSYNRHEGPLQATDGTISRVGRSALEPGLGVDAVGGGSPAIPGVAAYFRLADAVFQPRAAEHALAARQHAARTTTHDLLLDVALAYLDLLRAYQQQAIAQETLDHAQQLADLTATFSKAGQGAQADADRARAELMVRKNDLEQAHEASQVASSRLVELLDLDPLQLLAPSEPAIAPVELVSRDQPVQDLVAQGLRSRPELAESQQLVCEAIARFNRERYAPLLPSMLLGVSYSGYGGGQGAQIDPLAGRYDLDAAVYWEMRGLGVGEAAAREETHARMHQAQMRQVLVLDRVAREVAEAYAQVHARHRQILVSQSGIEAAIDSYRRNNERITQGQGLPIEALQALQALDQARRLYLRAVADYDEAQFRLYRAIGCALSDGMG